MKVADPSTMLHPSFPDGVNILFFAPRQEALPQPDCAGQLIRLHRCKVCPSLMQLQPGCCSHIASAHLVSSHGNDGICWRVFGMHV